LSGVDDATWSAEAEPVGPVFERLLAPGAVTAVYQPIVNLVDGSVLGYEALARMPGPPELPPDAWLSLADQLGRRAELENACIRAAAMAGPPPDRAALFVNIGPAYLHDPGALALRQALPDRLVLELTEREAVEDYDGLRERIAAWRERGVRVAIDDTGSGWSTLRHVVQLRPDFIKLDRSLIAHVDRDRAKRALVCAMVAFARESGSMVIAEGVERRDELAALLDAEVTFVQGWLLARPGPAWVRPAAIHDLDLDDVDDGDVAHPRRARDHERLEDRLARCTEARDACTVVADHLARIGGVMPSVYLERGGLLRCQAQRGLWQVLDGMPPGVGITGRTFASGDLVLVDDVTLEPGYLEAIPGVVSEVCVPVRVGTRAVGSLNLESFSRMRPDVVAEVRHCAEALGRRLAEIGTMADESPRQRLVRHAARLAEQTDHGQLRRAVVDAAIDVSAMDSAALVLQSAGGLAVVEARGRLAVVLRGIDAGDLAGLGGLVDQVASCYTAGDSTGAGFAGTDGLRAAGARTVVVLPLLARGQRLGILLVADTVAARLDTADAELLELLGAHAATCLDNAAMLDELRDRARRDPLTGLANHSAFHDTLAQMTTTADGASVLLADIDRFKSVNDEKGHLTGDDALRSVARALAGVVRAEDQLFRIGGDEFAAVLPGVGELDAAALAARLVLAAGDALGHHGAALSIGVAFLGAGEAPADALERADRALYRAKREGRGVCCADPPLDTAVKAAV
jgi:diguanylate cyclase (GGDEF)-like protein